MIKKLFSSLGLLLILTLFSFLLVLGGEEKPAGDPLSPPLAPAGFVSSQDLSLLASHLGASVPYISANGTGRVEDVPFGEGYARMLTWTDENGLTVRCAVPSSAAALLRSDQASPTGEYCVIDGMTAIVCADAQTAELHFGDSFSTCCLSGAVAVQDLIEAAGQLQFIP